MSLSLFFYFGLFKAHYNSVQTPLVSKRNEYNVYMYYSEELKVARQMMEAEPRRYYFTSQSGFNRSHNKNREACKI